VLNRRAAEDSRLPSVNSFAQLYERAPASVRLPWQSAFSGSSHLIRDFTHVVVSPDLQCRCRVHRGTFTWCTRTNEVTATRAEPPQCRTLLIGRAKSRPHSGLHTSSVTRATSRSPPRAELPLAVIALGRGQRDALLWPPKSAQHQKRDRHRNSLTFALLPVRLRRPERLDIARRAQGEKLACHFMSSSRNLTHGVGMSDCSATSSP
jgi:hypothetical protein